MESVSKFNHTTSLNRITTVNDIPTAERATVYSALQYLKNSNISTISNIDNTLKQHNISLPIKDRLSEDTLNMVILLIKSCGLYRLIAHFNPESRLFLVQDILSDANGNIYKGDFKDDTFNGKGIFYLRAVNGEELNRHTFS